jgi:hypothetical protein
MSDRHLWIPWLGKPETLSVLMTETGFYALLSLASDDIDIIPDYAKSVSDVYQEVALAILMESKCPDFLKYCEMTSRGASLPS